MQSIFVLFGVLITENAVTALMALQLMIYELFITVAILSASENEGAPGACAPPSFINCYINCSLL